MADASAAQQAAQAAPQRVAALEALEALEAQLRTARQEAEDARLDVQVTQAMADSQAAARRQQLAAERALRHQP
jgi:hypothetical protein